jgi:Zn-dependent peptidase ImmA (M78 family)
LAHEYGHVLMDRESTGIISKRSERAKLPEVRANSFGAAFLMPEDGIKQYLTLLGKCRIPRTHNEIFDGDDTVAVEFRATVDQKINLLDVLQLANYFGVSSEAILYRILNMRLISPSEREELQDLDEQKGKILREPLHLTNQVTEMDDYIDQRLIALAAEALQREEISTGYFKQLLRRINVKENNIDKILRNVDGGK